MNLRLKEICETKKIAVGALADKIGMSRPNMYNLVNGKITPSVEKLNEIATALDVELWELFTPSTEKGEFMACELVANNHLFNIMRKTVPSPSTEYLTKMRPR